MTVAPDQYSFVSDACSSCALYRSSSVNNLTGINLSLINVNGDYRKAHAAVLEAAYRGASQSETARNASKDISRNVKTVTARTIIKWIKGEHDMPAYALERAYVYLAKVERLAQRIEGRK